MSPGRDREREESIGQRGWGASLGSRGREKKAQAAMGEQRRGEVRQQAGLGRAGSRRGRGSEKVEQPSDEGGVGGGNAIDGEDKGGKPKRGRREAGWALLPVSPGTCWVLLGKSLSLSGLTPPLENLRLD